MTRKNFDQRMAALCEFVGDRPLDAALAAALNTQYAPDASAFAELTQLCQAGVAEGWLCEHEGGGIRYGRVTQPSSVTHGFSVDVVKMRDIVGPHHRHPNGEIDLIMPIAGSPTFDGHGAGWVVYGPGSAHSPTIAGGEALVLYLLPDGAIEFTRSGGSY